MKKLRKSASFKQLMKTIDNTPLSEFLPKGKTRSEKTSRTRILNALRANDRHVVWSGKVCPEGGPTFMAIPITTVGHLLRLEIKPFRKSRGISTGSLKYLEGVFRKHNFTLGQFVPQGCWD